MTRPKTLAPRSLGRPRVRSCAYRLPVAELVNSVFGNRGQKIPPRTRWNLLFAPPYCGESIRIDSDA